MAKTKQAPALKNNNVRTPGEDFTFRNPLTANIRFNEANYVYLELNKETLQVAGVLTDRVNDKRYSFTGQLEEVETKYGFMA